MATEIFLSHLGEVLREAGGGGLGTDYQFTGQRNQAELGIYWFSSRWMDPSFGRFTQPDSIVPTSTQGTQAWDRYGFVNNNPVRYNDPTGHMIDNREDAGSKWGCSDPEYCENGKPKQQSDPLADVVQKDDDDTGKKCGGLCAPPAAPPGSNPDSQEDVGQTIHDVGTFLVYVAIGLVVFAAILALLATPVGLALIASASTALAGLVPGAGLIALMATGGTLGTGLAGTAGALVYTVGIISLIGAGLQSTGDDMREGHVLFQSP